MTAGNRLTPSSLAHVDTWVFDVDNTLYPAHYDLFDLVDTRIGEFVSRVLGLDAAAARRMQKDYFRDYGTTLRGMMLHHGVDPVAFLDYVDQIDVSRVPPSPRLDLALARLDARKVIFTNASARHAEKVIERLGIAHHFDAIFDIAAADFVPKPHPETYLALLARHSIDPRAAVMVEDIARNLEPAAALGMATVWVRNDLPWGRDDSDGDYIDHVIDDLGDWLTDIVDAVPRR